MPGASTIASEPRDATAWTPERAALDLWWVDLARVGRDGLLARDLLSREERERAERQRRLRPAAADEFTAARTALRHVLARYVGAAPGELVFRSGPHGRPALAGPDAPDFNLSHSGGHALIAVAGDAALGVDLQRCDRSRDLHGLAHRFFAPLEVEALEALGDGDGAPFARAFFRLWVCKEAYLKALGLSIATLPSRSFGFALEERGARLVETGPESAGGGPAAAWQVVELAAPAGFAAAVVWRGGRRGLRHFAFPPRPVR